MAPTFPAEIWHDIVASLPRDQQRTFLGVSRALRRIAFRRVFKFIRLYFLSGEDISSLPEPPEDFESEMEPDLMCDDPEGLLERLRERTSEILDRIIEDPEFAAAVKELGIAGSAHGADQDADEEDGDDEDIDDEGEDEEKELRKKLKDAIQALPCLKKVTWWGENPRFAAFAPLFPSNLEVLNLNASISFATGCEVLASSNIQELQLVNPLRDVRYPELNWVVSDNSILTSLKSVVLHMAPQLRRLALPYLAVEQLFKVNLDKLIGLEIYATQQSELKGLNRLWPRLPNLRELSLLGNIVGGAIRELPLDTHVVPLLHSFSLAFVDFLEGEDDASHLAQFLDQHVELTRLSLDLGSAEIAENLGPLVTSLSNLKSLHALGFVLDSSVNRDELEMLTVAFAHKNLQALHLQTEWEDTTADLPLGLLMFKRQLSYLYYGGRQAGDGIPVDHLSIAAYVRKTELVGDFNCLWDISREGEEIEATRRPPWQTEFPLESDFTNPNHFWLIRHSRR